MTESELRHHVLNLVSGAKKRTSTDDIVHRIISQWKFSGPDEDTLRVCAFGFVGNLVRIGVRSIVMDDEDVAADTQMLLPGWEYLQKSYCLANDDGESEIIPIDEMTKADFRKKASHFLGTMRGSRQHLAELTRFYEMKFGEGLNLSETD